MKKLTKEEHNREQNKKYKTLVKNDRKRVIEAFANKVDDSILSGLVRRAQCNLDKSVTKKIIHGNNAARRKSALFRMLSSTK